MFQLLGRGGGSGSLAMPARICPQLYSCNITSATVTKPCAVWSPHRTNVARHSSTVIFLVHAGLATAEPETMKAGAKPVQIVRVWITDAGRGGDCSSIVLGSEHGRVPVAGRMIRRHLESRQVVSGGP